jgi:hypothetical protein
MLRPLCGISDCCYDAFDIGLESLMVESGGVATRQSLKSFGQLTLRRHRGLVNEHRNDRYVAIERCCNL